MIVRIMAEGQFDVGDDALDDLNRLDREVVEAIDAGDDDGFGDALRRLVEAVQSRGRRLADDDLRPSEAVVPAPDATLSEVRELLGEEGLLPG